MMISSLCFLSGCGGGAEIEEIYTVDSGVAQKGPLVQGSLITINELSGTNYVQNGKSYSFQTLDNLGRFSLANVPFTSNYLQTTAQGYYYNELTGVLSDEIIYLHGLSNIATGQSKTVNINILSTFVKNRTLNLLNVTSNRPTFNNARDQAQTELLNNFYIYNHNDIINSNIVDKKQQPSSFTALDLSNQRIGDQILAAYSAIVMQIKNNVPNINTFISEIANDLLNDGVINSNSIIPNNSATSTFYNLSATSTRSLICAAFKDTNFNNVASSLNAFYKTNYLAQDLSQWVDTSGCIDKVINKYKFSKTGGIVESPSRSPVYQASNNDIGKCIIIGTSSSNSISKLYYNGSTTLSQESTSSSIYGNPILVKSGDSFVIAITGNSSGDFSTYLQRFNSINGTCVANPGMSSSVNLLKFTININ